MAGPESRGSNADPLKTMQILWASLLAGVAMFLVITLAVRSGQGELFAQKDLFEYSSMLVIVGVMVAAFCVLAFFTVPSLIVNSQRQALASRRPDAAPIGSEGPDSEALSLTSIYQTQFIVGMALLEGAAFLNLVVYLIEGSPVSLAVAGVLLVVMATRLPTRSGLGDWIDRQRRLLRDESQTPRTG